MKESFSKKEAIEILTRALTVKDQKADKPIGSMGFNDDESMELKDVENMAGEFGISKEDLQKAVTEVTQTKEYKRDELYPEVVATRWVEGRLNEQDIENIFSELKLEFGDSRHQWTGRPAEVHQIGSTWEYPLKDATVLLTDKDNGYQLQVIKQQFFHGNNLEAALVAIPAAFILGLLPVAAAAEWFQIYLPVFIALVCYFVSFSLVKKFTHKKRSSTVSKLLHITEFAEARLQKHAEAEDSKIIQEALQEDIKSEENEKQNKKLRS